MQGAGDLKLPKEVEMADWLFILQMQDWEQLAVKLFKTQARVLYYKCYYSANLHC